MRSDCRGTFGFVERPVNLTVPASEQLREQRDIFGEGVTRRVNSLQQLTERQERKLEGIQRRCGQGGRKNGNKANSIGMKWCCTYAILTLVGLEVAATLRAMAATRTFMCGRRSGTRQR